ncbi:MAG: alpha/beta hydrolase [Alphaproteobacteria bacterium]|nr:alpha/beta hydrolase [Alphaproteobacteria bacterium]
MSKYYKVGNPKKLVVFIHGYNGTPEAIEYAVQYLLPNLKDTVVVIPRAPFPCEKDGENLQWLSFYQVDPLALFREESTTTEEIFEIFNKLGNSFAEVANQMNEFISEQQKIWKIDDANTFVMGFSQGAMISMYTAFTRKTLLGGCISVAGIIAGKDRLKNEILSRPPLLLLHGRADTTVQYKTLPKTEEWLNNNKISYKKYEFDKLAHRMNADEMKAVADFINC